MPGDRPLKAIICDHDPWSARASRALLEDAGFEVIGEAPNAVEAIRITELLRPTFVLIALEQAGLSGLEALPDLLRGDEPPEVVLVANDDSAREAAKKAGAFELVVKGESEMIERLFEEVRELLETGERRKSRDRRSGQERRQAQDWSKVTHERRSGVDRRGGLRRERDVTSTAKDILKQRQKET
jgi:AmiR/NasT family two-component response regulator